MSRHRKAGPPRIGPRASFVRAVVATVALVMVPVVILAVPTTARAAEVAAFGRWVASSGQSDRLIDLFKGADYFAIKCDLGARYKATRSAQFVEVREGSCDSFSDAVKEGKPYTFSVSGKTSTGGDCQGSATGTFGGSSSWLGVSKHATFGLTVALDAVTGPQLSPGCDVSSWTLHAPGNTIWDAPVDVYGSIDLGAVPSVVDSGTAGNGDWCGWTWGDAQFLQCFQDSLYPNGRLDFKGPSSWCPWLTQNQAAGEPHVISVARSFAYTVEGWHAATEIDYGHSSFTSPRVDISGSTTICRAENVVKVGALAAGQPDQDLVLVYAYRKTQNSVSGWTFKSAPKGRVYVKSSGSAVSDPGEWSAEDPVTIGDGNELEEPAPKPVDERDSCDFKWSDPSTYASAGICAVVSMLTKIWETLKALPGDILGGLRGVFVPGDGVVEAEMTQIKDSWSGTAPFVVADAVSDLPDWLAEPESGGCEGMAVGPISFGMGTTPHTFRPFSTCASERANLANVVRIGLMVLVYVGAGLASLRIVGSSLGVDLSIGKGEE